MEAKFCPQCGTARVGNFCGRCGYNFATVISNSGAESNSDVSSSELNSNVRALPKGLVRGDAFDQNLHCDNCGLKLKKSKCEECGE